MMRTEAVSARLGQVRFVDLRLSKLGEGPVSVRALDAEGSPVDFSVGLTEVWGAKGWRPLFACPVCQGAAWVLLVGKLVVACRRCRPRLTTHQAEKNTAEWVRERALVDQLVRQTDRKGVLPNQQRAIAKEIRRRGISRAAGVLDLAARAVRLADALQEDDHAST